MRTLLALALLAWIADPAHAAAPSLADGLGGAPELLPLLEEDPDDPLVVTRKARAQYLTGESLATAGIVTTAVAGTVGLIGGTVAVASLIGDAFDDDDLPSRGYTSGMRVLYVGTGFAIAGVGVTTAGALLGAAAVRRLGMPVGYTGLVVAGAGALTLTGVAVAGAVTGEFDGAAETVGAMGLFALPLGLAIQLLENRAEYRRFERGPLALSPTRVSRSPGLALAARF